MICCVLFCAVCSGFTLYFFFFQRLYLGKNERTSEPIHEQDGTRECVCVCLSASDATSKNNNVLCHNCGNIVFIPLFYITSEAHTIGIDFIVHSANKMCMHRFVVIDNVFLFFPSTHKYKPTRIHTDMQYKHGPNGKKSIWMKNVMNESFFFFETWQKKMCIY